MIKHGSACICVGCTSDREAARQYADGEAERSRNGIRGLGQMVFGLIKLVLEMASFGGRGDVAYAQREIIMPDGHRVTVFIVHGDELVQAFAKAAEDKFIVLDRDPKSEDTAKA